MVSNQLSNHHCIYKPKYKVWMNEYPSSRYFRRRRNAALVTEDWLFMVFGD
jgi:hypothetical protein